MTDFEVKESASAKLSEALTYEKLKSSYELAKSAVLANTPISITDINYAIRFIYLDLVGSSLVDTTGVFYPRAVQISTTNDAFAKYNGKVGTLHVGNTFRFNVDNGAGLTSSYIVKLTQEDNTLTINTRNSVYVYKYSKPSVDEHRQFEISAEDLKLLERLTLLQEFYYYH